MAPKDPEALWKYLQNRETLDGEDLRGVILGNFCFAGTSLEGADLRDARLEGADFSECNVSPAKFAGATLSRASFVRAKGAGADFSESMALGADFSMGDSHQLASVAQISNEPALLRQSWWMLTSESQV